MEELSSPPEEKLRRSRTFLEKYGKFFWLIPPLFLLLVLAVVYTATNNTVTNQQAPRPFAPTRPIPSSPTPTTYLYREPTGSAATSNWKTYRNKKYGFEVKYPNLDNYAVTELKPETYDTFLSEIYIARNNGSFSVEIVIEKNPTPKSDMPALKNEIMRVYGVSKWFNFPSLPWLPSMNAQLKEFNIDNNPAIKSNYLAQGESLTRTPAVQVFTLNSQYIYRIDYIGDIEEGDQILSTFQFTN